jgi:hypothetical protein
MSEDNRDERIAELVAERDEADKLITDLEEECDGYLEGMLFRQAERDEAWGVANELVAWLHSDYYCTCSPMAALEEFVSKHPELRLPGKK